MIKQDESIVSSDSQYLPVWRKLKGVDRVHGEGKLRCGLVSETFHSGMAMLREGCETVDADRVQQAMTIVLYAFESVKPHVIVLVMHEENVVDYPLSLPKHKVSFDNWIHKLGI